MKGIEKPAKRIFSQNKEAEKFVKTDKSAVEKTLALIAVESGNPKGSVSKKRKIADIDEKSERKKKDLQIATDAHDSLSQNPSKNSKSLSSDKKRLESVKEWQKQLDQQKATMKKALSTNNAGDGLNKKVIFDCEESEIDKTNAGINESNTQSETISKADKLKPLFDESLSEESESEEKVNERFRYKKEFEGKSGKKLKELQKKYGNDDRFKLSEKFLDGEDAEDNEESANNLAGDDDEDAIKDEEIENSLKIADQVLQNNEIRIKSKKKKIFKDVSALRFDPDKITHKELIQSPQKKKSVTFDASTKSEEIPALPEVKKSLYYEVKTSLKEAFTKSAEQPFSLLASYANPNVPVEAEISSDEETQETVLHPLEDDESYNDEEFETENVPLTDAGTVPVDLDTEAVHPDKTFFFMVDDERLTEGVKKFHRTMEEEEMWTQWKEQHKKMKLLFHTRQKHIVRRLNYKKSAVFKNKSSNKH